MRILLLIFSFFVSCQAIAQVEVKHRVIFIGDAGEMNPYQRGLLAAADTLLIVDRTNVIYLGDNIYPDGMGLSGSTEELETQQILRSQYEPFISKNIPTYFIPGNHDWDKSRELGLQKIQAQGKFLESQQNPLLKLIPTNGCPDPVEISLSDSLSIIAIDSEWWLFPHDKTNLAQDCGCLTEEDVLESLEDLLYKNRNKTVYLISHHPFQTDGVHGGNYSIKDHLFPLTNINPDLYIPLPVLGSLYPLLRSTVLQSPEDLIHPEYQRLRDKIYGVFDGFPNLVYVGGHEHGLQLLKDKEDRVQVVSGSGAKSTFLRKSENSLFQDKSQGLVVMDMLGDRSTRISYYIYENASLAKAFEYVWPYRADDGYDQQVDSDVAALDSAVIRANPDFDRVKPLHRKLFGENYRKEWAAETKVPVIRLSQFEGGLTLLKKGGGMQTVSLRLADSTGREWVLRSVNKNSESLLPEALYGTFANELLDDAVSAQHPYSALMVKPIADAVDVPTTDPIIGVVAPDPVLGKYNTAFANTLNLLEEREPLGDSDNTLKMLRKVYEDNDDTFAAKTFFRSRMLDLLLGDWDRHEDQYRWFDESKDKDKDYLVVPRDRDQVIRLMDGVFPPIVSLPWAMPTLQGFDGTIRNVNYSLIKSSFLNAHPKMQFSYEDWRDMTGDFVQQVTDSVLEASIRRLPASSQEIRHNELLDNLKQRRDEIAEAMDRHYRFINSVVDIRLTDKNERVQVLDAEENGMRILIHEINKDGEIKSELMDKVYDPAITREIRLFLSKGNDSVITDYSQKKIRLRIVGSAEPKDILVKNAGKKIKYYTNSTTNNLLGKPHSIKSYISGDSSNTAFVPTNLYNVTMPLANIGYNLDDGLMLGAGFRHTQQEGFRKRPYTHRQELLLSYFFGTGNFKIDYEGSWVEAVGKADLVINANAFAPNNTQNFFGLGNDTAFEQDLGISYYRTRYHLYQVTPQLRWKYHRSTLSVGSVFEYYRMNPEDNKDRFVFQNASRINTYDSLTLTRDKQFVGLNLNYQIDSRDHMMLPTSGGFFHVNFRAYEGLNQHSRSFSQLQAELGVFKSLFGGSVVLADRIGGGATLGDAAFYQSMFLGGQGNLWGYRKYRFAGEHMLYNNLELRIKLLNITSYLLPGQLGLTGFYDVGKVWAKGHNTATVHHGVGGGVYYSPGQAMLFQLVAAKSNEGWLPNFTMGFRF